MKEYYQDDVDKWVQDNNKFDSYALLHQKMPKMKAKLNKLAKKIASTLKEVQEVFPDAEYYTGSGGFNLVLGEPHANMDVAQRQRIAWSGSSIVSIGDGDW